MSHKYPFCWPNHAQPTLDDGAVNLPENCPLPFPGYVAKKGHPFMPQHTLTHPGTNLAPGVGRYSYGDSPEAFETNRQRMGPDWHYAYKNVTYHCNTDGYRAPEWDQIDWANAIVLIGCSVTFGAGLAEDETIGYYVSQLTGRPTVNLGFPSGSNQLLLNNAAALRNHYGQVYAVAINWTTLDRFHFYGPYSHTVGLWTEPDAEADGVNLYDLYKARNYSELDRDIEAYYQAQCARAIWQDRTRYVTLSYFAQTAHYTRSDIYVRKINVPLEQRARDLIHPGPEASRDAARLIVARIQQ